MFSNKLETWIGLVGLTVALTGCPGGDDSGTDTNNTTNPSTTNTPMTGGEMSTGEENTTGEPPAGTTTDDPPSDDTTTGEPPAGCDPPCAANEECIEGVCFPTGECVPECVAPAECVDGVCEVPPPTDSDYGPCDACAPGEMPVQITGLDGCFCSPLCDGMTCPPPNESTAQAQCALETMAGAGATQCALICDVAMNNCPTGATCQDASAAGAPPGVGICTHPA